MKIIVQFSGGKDSQASLIWAVKKYGAKNVTAQYSDTKWEHPLTYQHINNVVHQLGVKLVILTSKKYIGGMVDLARQKKRFPASKSKYCTTELKVKPFIDWILDEVKDNILIVQGIRKNESKARSKMDETCRLFKYYLKPYKIDKNGKPVFHTYRKKDVLNFISKYDDSIMRPMFDKKGQYVIDYIYDNGQEPNPLYKMGNNRVGCYPCIMCKHEEIKQMAKRDPQRIDYIEKIEKDLKTTFFTTGKIPKYACKNGKFPTIKEVVKYVDPTPDLFEEVYQSCMSYYNQCE